MAGLSSADIFSILEKEIEKSNSDEQNKSEDQPTTDNDVQSDGKVILQNSADSGSIVRSSRPQQGEETAVENGTPGKVIEHDFTKNTNKPGTDFPNTEDIAVVEEENLNAYEPSPGIKEKRGGNMKKNLRIKQDGDLIKVRVFVEDEELCGMALSKEAGNSITLAGVRLYIDGEETVLEV